jgi:hypothetical protein
LKFQNAWRDLQCNPKDKIFQANLMSLCVFSVYLEEKNAALLPSVMISGTCTETMEGEEFGECFVRSFGAQERTRTSTYVSTLAPEASASTNSATWATGEKRDSKLFN